MLHCTQKSHLMKSNLIISVLLIFSVIALTNQGCNKDSSPDTQEFIIKIDSITHADTIDSSTINSTDPFVVLFYGKIGDNECFAFSNFSPAFGADFINITVYGTETIKNDCAGGPVYLDGKGAAFTDMTAGEWTINVFQPEGIAPIESKVYVK